MKEFKKGEIVRCIDPIQDLRVGKEYVVTEQRGDQVGVEGSCDGYPGWNVDRFELSEAATARRILKQYEI
jgi:hypothetical protein